MSLNPIELELIRNSFNVLSKNLETHSQEFYEALFRRDPSLRRLFRKDLSEQGMKFMTALGTIVSGLDSEDQNAEEYLALGHYHAGIGVRPEHFEPMGEALIDTLRSVFGEEFTPALENAWREAFDEVRLNMVERGKIGKT